MGAGLGCWVSVLSFQPIIPYPFCEASLRGIFERHLCEASLLGISVGHLFEASQCINLLSALWLMPSHFFACLCLVYFHVSKSSIIPMPLVCLTLWYLCAFQLKCNRYLNQFCFHYPMLWMALNWRFYLIKCWILNSNSHNGFHVRSQIKIFMAHMEENIFLLLSNIRGLINCTL